MRTYACALITIHVRTAHCTYIRIFIHTYSLIHMHVYVCVRVYASDKDTLGYCRPFAQ